jgi:hypothetical protein
LEEIRALPEDDRVRVVTAIDGFATSLIKAPSSRAAPRGFAEFAWVVIA